MDKNNFGHTDRWVEERLALLNLTEEWQPNVNAAWVRLQEKQTTVNWVPGRWALVAMAAAVTFLLVMFVPSPQVLAHRCLECSLSVWESLSAAGASQTRLKPESERQVAPDFQLQEADGKEVKLSALKGRVVLVNFWATWCEGCQVEIPGFLEFTKKYQDKGLVVIGVSMDDDGWKSVKPWVKEKNVNYTIVIGSDELGKKYGLQAMPLTVLIGRDGKIADSHGGIVEKDATEEKIRALLAGGAR